MNRNRALSLRRHASESFGCRLAVFPLVITPDGETCNDEYEQSPFFDVRGAAEDALDGAAEVVAGGGDRECPHDAGDRFVHEELDRGDPRDADRSEERRVG